jgi:hypothetical protein
MNQHVQHLAMKLFEATQKKFPGIEFISIQEHPEQVNRYWINVSGDMNEDKQAVMRRFVADKAMKILVAEGLSFAVMLETNLESVH